MPGEKRSSDLSNRNRGANKVISRPSKSTPSTISAPPKVAIATRKPKKDDLHRRKNLLGDMIQTKQQHEINDHGMNISKSYEHTRGNSAESTDSIQDLDVTDKIAELERALVTAKEETLALGEELKKVKEHGRVYRDTIEDCQRQLSDRYAQSSTTVTSQEENEGHGQMTSWHDREYGNIAEENHALRRKVTGLQIRLQESPHVASNIEWNEMIARLHLSEKESQERLQQLLDLKHSVSALTRQDKQITDSELASQLDQLYYRFREWVVTHYRRAKLNSSDLSHETREAFQEICADLNHITSADRLAFYQAILSHTMMRIFREELLLGLPEQGPLASIRQLAAYVHSTGPSYRTWLRATIRALEDSGAKYALHEGKEEVLDRLATDIGHRLFCLTSTELSAQAQQALVVLLRDAADLQQTLLLQKAHYKIIFFRAEDGGVEKAVNLFDAQQMDIINDVEEVDDDMVTDKSFTFCVFPCLEKHGDETGEHMEVRNVLLKAKVCCTPR